MVRENFESKTTSKEHIPGDPIPKEELKTAEDIIQNGKKVIYVPEFRGKTNVKILINHPTVGVDKVAADEYAKTINTLLRDPNCNLLSRKKMEEILHEKGLWTKKDEEDLENILEEMNFTLIDISRMRYDKEDEKNKDEFIKLRAKWYTQRNKYLELFTQKQSYFDQTIEGRGEEARLKVQLTHCIKFDDGKYVWDNIKHLEDDSERDAVTFIFNEAIWFWNGLSQEVLFNLPEKVAGLFQGGIAEEDSKKPNMENKDVNNS